MLSNLPYTRPVNIYKAGKNRSNLYYPDRTGFFQFILKTRVFGARSSPGVALPGRHLLFKEFSVQCKNQG